MRLPFRVPPLGDQPFDVVGLGLNSVDLVAVVAEFPTSNSKQRLERFARLPGGQTATAMAVCARLGWRASYIGRFGDDDLGELSKASLLMEGVHIGAAATAAGATNQFAVVLVEMGSGARTVLWDRHPALSMEAVDIPPSSVCAGRIVVVDCHETAAATRAAQAARRAGIPVILDVERVRPGIGDLLEACDAIIAAERFPTELTGSADAGRALDVMSREFQAPLVAVTLGAEGSLARCGGREIRTPAFRVDCVDSTGAGDAFHGGFAAACLLAGDRSMGLEDALAYANAVAGLNCRALGARGGMPTAIEVEQLMLAQSQR